MTHTLRRTTDWRGHSDALRDLQYNPNTGCFIWTVIDSHSLAGRRALCRFHSDRADVTQGPPLAFRRRYQKIMRRHNRQEILRWFKSTDPDAYPVQPKVRHRHNAQWAWG